MRGRVHLKSVIKNRVLSASAASLTRRAADVLAREDIYCL